MAPYNPPFMRSLIQMGAVVASLALLAACPQASPTTTSSSSAKKPKLDDATVGKLAAILRAADRRIVDDSLRSAMGDSSPRVRERAAMALGQIGSAASTNAICFGRGVHADEDNPRLTDSPVDVSREEQIPAPGGHDNLVKPGFINGKLV